MSEREKEILENIAEALPKMSDFDKGYFLGIMESKVTDKREQLNSKTDVRELQEA